ncbi:MAG TPA: hemerythrin domain-containing protein [Terriglobales bacterium]|nr:hemerythrin domain-containing protein [Terriglobales bacterium]
MASVTEGIAKVFGKAKGAAKALEGYPKIFHHLAAEHAEVSTLMTRVASSDDSAVRDELFPAICKHLLAHAHAEEKEFYPALNRLPQLAAMVGECLAEHKTIEAHIDRLKVLSTADPGWAAQFERLVAAVQQHVEREEQQLFPRASESISDEQGDELYHSYEDQEEREKAVLDQGTGLSA